MKSFLSVFPLIHHLWVQTGRGRREAAREQPESAMSWELAGGTGRGRAEM